MASQKDKKTEDELDAVSAAYESISAKLEDLRKKQAELSEDKAEDEDSDDRKRKTDDSEDDPDAIAEIEIDSESEEEVEIKVKSKKSDDEEDLEPLPGTEEEPELPKKQVYKANDPLDDEDVKDEKPEEDTFEEVTEDPPPKKASEEEVTTLSQRSAKLQEEADEMEAWEKLNASSSQEDKTPKPTFSPVSQDEFRSKLRRPPTESDEDLDSSSDVSEDEKQTAEDRDEDAFGSEVQAAKAGGRDEEPDSLDDLADEPIEEPQKEFNRPTEVDSLEDDWAIRHLKPKHQVSYEREEEALDNVPVERELRRPPVRENNYFDNRNQPLPRKKASLWHLLILLLIGGAVIGGTVYVLKYQFNAPPKPTPSPEIASPSPVPTPTPEPPKTVEDRSQFRVRVLNGTSRSGWAMEVLTKLKEAGFQSDRAGNASNQDFEETVIKVKEGSQSAALIETIKQDLGSEFTPTSETSLAENDRADAEITLGQK